MKTNYREEMMSVIASLPSRPGLLLHACCAPCSGAALESVVPHFETALFYYNPNIFPADEYDKRADQFPLLLKASGLENEVEFLAAGYDHGEFLEMSLGKEREPEGGARCAGCFRLRLERTAREAKARGFGYFATTLTVSPHKDAEAINALGYELSDKYGVRWLPSDFKKGNGYLRSIELSREYGLYRQDYCGCEFTMGGDKGD